MSRFLTLMFCLQQKSYQWYYNSTTYKETKIHVGKFFEKILQIFLKCCIFLFSKFDCLNFSPKLSYNFNNFGFWVCIETNCMIKTPIAKIGNCVFHSFEWEKWLSNYEVLELTMEKVLLQQLIELWIHGI